MRIEVNYIVTENKHDVLGAPNGVIEEAIRQLSYFWNSLEFFGEMKDGKFYITEVRNHRGETLYQYEVQEMYYETGNPECIRISDDYKQV